MKIMNGVKYLKEQGIQDRIINHEDLPEYQMKLSGMLEHFHYLMDKSKFNKPTVIGCLHPFNDVVSGNDGDFCCKCQSYLKSNRL